MLKHLILTLLLSLATSCVVKEERSVLKELDAGRLVLAEDGNTRVLALKSFGDVVITQLDSKYNIDNARRTRDRNFTVVEFLANPVIYNEKITLNTFHRYKLSPKDFVKNMKTVANDCQLGYRQQIIYGGETEIILLEDCQQLKNTIGARTSLHRLIKSENNLHLLTYDWYNLRDEEKSFRVNQKLPLLKETLFCGKGLYNIDCLEFDKLF